MQRKTNAKAHRSKGAKCRLRNRILERNQLLRTAWSDELKHPMLPEAARERWRGNADRFAGGLDFPAFYPWRFCFAPIS